MENANDHPFKVSIVKDAEFFANSHPYKVTIEGGGGNEGRVVDELPEEGEPGYIYLVLKESTPEGDIYDEYMWVLQRDGETYGWEHIGATNEVTIVLYDTTGQNTDGAMTQKATTDAINNVEGQAKLLTQTDYSSGVQFIKAWELPVGLYRVDNKGKSPSSNAFVHWRPAMDITLAEKSCNVFLVADHPQSNVSKTIVMFYSGGGDIYDGYYKIDVINVGTSGELNRRYRLLSTQEIVDNLTSTETNEALSANQGKVLKGMIDELDSKVGQAKVLTTEDYNWNSTSHSAVEPYDSVALWLLEPGMYIFPSGTNGYIGYRNNIWYSTSEKKLYQVTPQGTYSKMIIAWEEYHVSYGSPMDIGTVYGVQPSSGNISQSCSLGAPISDISAPQIASRTGTALAASVGYSLSQKIGDLTTLTTTAKTSTVAAINELATTIGNIQTILNIVNNGSGN